MVRKLVRKDVKNTGITGTDGRLVSAYIGVDLKTPIDVSIASEMKEVYPLREHSHQNKHSVNSLTG